MVKIRDISDLGHFWDVKEEYDVLDAELDALIQKAVLNYIKANDIEYKPSEDAIETDYLTRGDAAIRVYIYDEDGCYDTREYSIPLEYLFKKD